MLVAQDLQALAIADGHQRPRGNALLDTCNCGPGDAGVGPVVGGRRGRAREHLAGVHCMHGCKAVRLLMQLSHALPFTQMHAAVELSRNATMQSHAPPSCKLQHLPRMLAHAPHMRADRRRHARAPGTHP